VLKAHDETRNEHRAAVFERMFDLLRAYEWASLGAARDDMVVTLATLAGTVALIVAQGFFPGRHGFVRYDWPRPRRSRP
jgi:hypothetical protein